ncbi:MAG TPA: DNA mismatch repair endonuclease MutL [Microscillaceae bacterium]|nr:DNA mismatch repair endonuclease MutL [Microscillaceae bacterium]
MEDIIRLLPESLANQIAAGEVVQRPASVVKELMENALDAQSKSIQVVIQEAGKKLIQVVDDGIGMSETDARMCFERHATSKISQSADLFAIRTLGFRGEALASIAAVAQVELKTKRKEDDWGTQLLIEGSQFKAQNPVACLPGTSLAVSNLFFNVPARRKFLKSNPVEMRHILDEFVRIALSHPEISFALYNNDLEVYQLQAGKLSQRIVDLFGKHYKQQLAPCEEETPILKIQGYIGKPDLATKTKQEQFIFVNRRYIRNNYLNHAITGAYENLLPADKTPFFALFLTIDPSLIDINVHPKKTEIKFEDDRSMYAILQAAVRKALSQHHLSPALDFNTDVNMQSHLGKIEQNLKQPLQQWQPPSEQREKSNLKNWQKLYESLEKQAIEKESYQADLLPDELTEKEQVRLSRISDNLAEKVDTDKEEVYQAEKYFLQIQTKFILCSVRSGLLLIDQKAAYERILYDAYLQKINHTQNPSPQQLLFPIEIAISQAEWAVIQTLEAELKQMGFIFDKIADDTLAFSAIPEGLTLEGEWWGQLLDSISTFGGNWQTERKTFLALFFAKRMANYYQKNLNQAEIKALIDSLFASTNPNFTPHGKKIFNVITLEQLNLLLTQNLTL